MKVTLRRGAWVCCWLRGEMVEYFCYAEFEKVTKIKLALGEERKVRIVGTVGRGVYVTRDVDDDNVYIWYEGRRKPTLEANGEWFNDGARSSCDYKAWKAVTGVTIRPGTAVRVQLREAL
jgi:hypothetical protein